MGISSAGLGSGMDLNSLITQMLQTEKQPLNALTTKKQDFNNQLSAFGRVKSDLDAFRSAVSSMQADLDFSATKTTSSSTTTLTATSTNTAVAGAYDIKVSTLAQAGVKASSARSNSSDPIGADNLANGGPSSITLSAGDKSFNITVEATDTLATLRDKINSSTITGSDGKSSTQSLARASIINTGTSSDPKYKLVVSSTDKGTANDVTIDASADPALQSYLGFTSAQDAQNAKFTVNGLEVERSSNTVTDVIDGVTLNLTDADKVNPKAATLTVAQDTDAVTKKVNDFTSAYNKLADTVSSLHQKGGALEADNSATSVIAQLQGVFNQPANVAGTDNRWLAQVGISFGKDGHLALDSSTFTKALGSNFNGTVSLFTDTNAGFSHRLYNAASDMLNNSGLVDSRISGIKSRAKYLDTSIDRENLRLDNVETRLRSQFAKLDSLLGTMKNTGNYLSSQLR